MCDTPTAEPDPEEGTDSDDKGKSNSEVESEKDEVLRDSRNSLYADQRTAVFDSASEVAQIAEDVNTAVANSVATDVWDSTYDETGIGMEPVDARGRALRTQAEDYRENDVGTQERKGRLFARVKGIALLTSLTSATVAIAALIISIFNVSRSGTQAPGLTPAQIAAIQKQIDRWWSLSDADLWAAVVTYCDRWNPSWQAQILMMDTIKKLSRPLPGQGWLWRGTDLSDHVEALVNTYGDFTAGAGQARSRILYVRVAALTYDGLTVGTVAALPRQVAADLVELAITDIVVKTKPLGRQA
jgi:hypothetical protein